MGLVYFCPGSSAYDDWEYCVNYTTFGGLDVTSECTNDLQIILSPLEENTLYTFVVTASGPGGGKTTPNQFLFQSKLAGKEVSVSECFGASTTYICLVLCQLHHKTKKADTNVEPLFISSPKCILGSMLVLLECIVAILPGVVIQPVHNLKWCLCV